MKGFLTAGAVLGALLAPSAWAQESDITIKLPAGQSVQRMQVAYTCDDKVAVTAEYLNAPSNSLATLTRKGEFVVLANVLAGSGAKYAGGKYVWWTKGDNADLYDLTKGENAKPVSCRAGK